MNSVETLRALFDEKKIQVIQTLILKQGDELTLQELAKNAKVSLATTYRICQHLTKIGICTRKKIKHLTLYRYSTSSAAQEIANILYERPQPLTRFLDLVKGIAGITRILQHGAEKEDRANIVLIGPIEDKEAVNQAVASIREEQGFTISHLILEQEQFEMLESMGQFSGNNNYLL